MLVGLHHGVQSLLGQDQKTGDTDDGLEAGVCFINPDRMKMTFAGARFSLWRSNENGVTEIKGDRKGVGYSVTRGQRIARSGNIDQRRCHRPSLGRNGELHHGSVLSGG